MVGVQGLVGLCCSLCPQPCPATLLPTQWPQPRVSGGKAVPCPAQTGKALSSAPCRDLLLKVASCVSSEQGHTSPADLPARGPAVGTMLCSPGQPPQDPHSLWADPAAGGLLWPPPSASSLGHGDPMWKAWGPLRCADHLLPSPHRHTEALCTSLHFMITKEILKLQKAPSSR